MIGIPPIICSIETTGPKYLNSTTGVIELITQPEAVFQRVGLGAGITDTAEGFDPSQYQPPVDEIGNQ